MSTTEVTDAPLTAQPESTILFMSRRSGLRLTWMPRYPLRDARTGAPSGVSESRHIGFVDGALRIPREGDKVTLADTLDGGTFTAPAEEIIEWLEGHRLFGDIFEGFWRVDPTAPPASETELQALLIAATNLDDETLRRFIAEEEAGWNREAVLVVAREGLARVEQTQAEVQRRTGEAEAAHRAEVDALKKDLAAAEKAAKARTSPAPKPETKE